MLNSPKKSFLLLIYTEAMAGASLPRRSTCVPRPCHIRDPRVLDFFDISATVDFSFLTDCSNSGSSSLFGEIFERCSDDSMSPSS